MRTIPYARQSIDDSDIKDVELVLQSEWLTQGPAVTGFEQALAGYCGARHAVAFNSATSALHAACLAAGLGPGGLAWTVPNTFVASANCALYCGAAVDFVDIDAKTYNMDAEKLAEKLAYCRKNNKPLPRVVVAVDFSGQPCDLAAIKELAGEYGFIFIEDASHAVGATYKDSKIGDGAYADMTVFSFHPVKIITTGEGGAVAVNDDKLREKLVLLRSHGITRDPARMSGQERGAWYYQQIELGFNYRMTDLQAALGRSQLRRIDTFLARRRQLAARYTEKMAGWALTTPYIAPDRQSAWHLYVVLLADAARRRRVFDSLRARDVAVNVHYIPVHTQPYYQKLGFAEGMFPVAEEYYKRCLSIPMYYGLTDDEQDCVLELMAGCLR